MNHTKPSKRSRVHWNDIYSVLDCLEDDELETKAVLTFPNTPNATAFITRIDVTGDRIVADARFDVDTAPEYWRTARGEDVSEALSITPRTWLQIRYVLDHARSARNFYNLATIGFPPDFEDGFCNFISEFKIGDDRTPVAIAFYDPE